MRTRTQTQDDDVNEFDDVEELEEIEEEELEEGATDDDVHSIHTRLAFGAWFLLTCLGGFILIVIGFMLYGVGGFVLLGGTIFTAFTSWFATWGSAKVRLRKLQAVMLIVVIVSGIITSLCIVAGVQNLTDDWGRQTLMERNSQRAATIKEGYKANRRGNRQNEKAAGDKVAGLLEKDAELDRKMLAREVDTDGWFFKFRTDWFRYVEYFNGIGILLIVSACLIYFWPQLDKDGNGKIDAFEKKRGIRRGK